MGLFSRIVGARDHRKGLRLPVSIRGALSGSTVGRRPVELNDISARGCCCASTFDPMPGAVVVLTIPSLAPMGAVVRWNSSDHIGLEFRQALHPSVVAHIVGADQSNVANADERAAVHPTKRSV